MTLAEALGKVRVSTAIVVLGLLGIAIGSVGPWVTTILGSVGGLHGDGRITLGAAAVALLALWLSTVVTRGRPILLAIAGLAILVALAGAGYDVIHIEHAARGITLFGHRVARAGWGVYLVAGSAGVALAALAQHLPSTFGRSLLATLSVGGAIGVVVAGFALEGSQPATAKASASAGISTAASPDPTTTSAQVAAPTAAAATTTTNSPDWMVQQGFTSAANPYCADALCGYVKPADQPCATGWHQIQSLCEQANRATTAASGTATAQSAGPLQNLCSGSPNGNYLSADSDVTCGFANNVFYEYWQASAGDPTQNEDINAWSPTTQATYPVSCVPGDGIVNCSISSNGTGQVQFTSGELTAYTSSEAAAYAASGKLGPNG